MLTRINIYNNNCYFILYVIGRIFFNPVKVKGGTIKLVTFIPILLLDRDRSGITGYLKR